MTVLNSHLSTKPSDDLSVQKISSSTSVKTAIVMKITISSNLIGLIA